MHPFSVRSRAVPEQNRPAVRHRDLRQETRHPEHGLPEEKRLVRPARRQPRRNRFPAVQRDPLWFSIRLTNEQSVALISSRTAGRVNRLETGGRAWNTWLVRSPVGSAGAPARMQTRSRAAWRETARRETAWPKRCCGRGRPRSRLDQRLLNKNADASRPCRHPGHLASSKPR